MAAENGGPIRIDVRLLAFLGAVVLIVAAVHQAADAHYDFGVFYYAARMVWDGARTSLYDLNVQHAFQLRYGRPPDLIFCSPPFALIPYLPLAALPIRAAFVLWTVISIALFTAAIKSLASRVGFRHNNWPILLSVAFMPIVAVLTHGQLSIVVLFVYVWCYALWKDGRRFSGGLVLALATVKFQLVAGFVCVLLLKRKWSELAGFGLGCAPLLAITWLIEGWRGLLRYPALLAHEETTTGVLPKQMASFRGFVTLLGGHGDYVWIVALLSLAAVVLAAGAWKDLDTGFAAAILATMLASYHFNPQDLSLALIPLFLAVKYMPRTATERVVAGAILLPTVLWFAGCFAVLAIPMVLMLVWAWSWPRLATLDPAFGPSGVPRWLSKGLPGQ